MNNDFKDIVFNRRSVRVFDENYKIPRDEMLQIIKETTEAPSSVNLQPWRFVVVESQEGKDKLRPLIQFNLSQNDTSSAMIIIFGDMKCYEKTEEIYGRAVEKGLMTEEEKKKMVDLIMREYTGATRQKMNDIVKIDSSLAAMQMQLVARAHGYETCLIGGFEEDVIAEEFGLDKERYVPVTIVAIGKGNEDANDSVRLEPEEVTRFE